MVNKSPDRTGANRILNGGVEEQERHYFNFTLVTDWWWLCAIVG